MDGEIDVMPMWCQVNGDVVLGNSYLTLMVTVHFSLHPVCCIWHGLLFVVVPKGLTLARVHALIA